MSDATTNPKPPQALLPSSPNDMPFGLSESHPHWLRNALVTLDRHSFVEIFWQPDDATVDSDGKPSGFWKVEIVTAAGKAVAGRHESIENALWFATTIADAKDDQEYERRKAEKAAALAKLTPGERKLLGL
jgi:hypothetical protein